VKKLKNKILHKQYVKQQSILHEREAAAAKQLTEIRQKTNYSLFAVLTIA